MLAKNITFRIAYLLLLTGMMGCSTRNNEISYSEDVDFAQLKRFAIKASDASKGSTTTSQRYVDALTETLQKKGFELVTPEQADWVVNHYFYRESEKNDKRLAIGLGTGSHSRNSSISIGGLFELPVGKQVIDYQSIQIDMLIDKEIVWQGNGSIEINPDNVTSMQDVPNKLINKVLADFPPKT